MAVWASILQSTADIRHLYRFAKEIHQKQAKSMVFQYSKYLLDFNSCQESFALNCTMSKLVRLRLS